MNDWLTQTSHMGARQLPHLHYSVCRDLPRRHLTCRWDLSLGRLSPSLLQGKGWLKRHRFTSWKGTQYSRLHLCTDWGDPTSSPRTVGGDLPRVCIKPHPGEIPKQRGTPPRARHLLLVTETEPPLPRQPPAQPPPAPTPWHSLVKVEEGKWVGGNGAWQRQSVRRLPFYENYCNNYTF